MRFFHYSVHAIHPSPTYRCKDFQSLWERQVTPIGWPISVYPIAAQCFRKEIIGLKLSSLKMILYIKNEYHKVPKKKKIWRKRKIRKLFCQVYYCGRDCQKKNWKVHKPTCKSLPYKVGTLQLINIWTTTLINGSLRLLLTLDVNHMIFCILKFFEGNQMYY